MMREVRPAEFCRELIAALDASDGRRRRRKRNTTPDAIGMAVKRELLEQTITADPAPEMFEDWLYERCLVEPNGGVHAMALSILEEWRFAAQAEDFRCWLAQGAPSDDAGA
ncbi:MAG: hypothetical protein WEE89_12275 [Gemmatimonadota bacterium]